MESAPGQPPPVSRPLQRWAEMEVVQGIVLCSPAHPVGRDMQLALHSLPRRADGAQRIARKRLPEGWSVEACAAEMEREHCQSLGLDVVVYRHHLRTPRATHNLVSMHFLDPKAPQRRPLTQSFGSLGGGRAADYARTVALACSALAPRRQGRQRLLMLGVGGATATRALHDAGWDIVGVDLSAAVVRLAQRHFGAPPPGPRMEYVVGDAFEYMRRPRRRKFQAVVCDLFTNDDVGAQRMPELIALAADLLEQDGVFVTNNHGQARSEALHVILRSFGVGSPSLLSAWCFPVPLEEMAIIAVRKSGDMPANWRQRLQRVPEPLRAYALEHTEPDSVFVGYRQVQRLPRTEWRDAHCCQEGGVKVLFLPGTYLAPLGKRKRADA
eukprot:Hpha_TRINITY_DN792_c0_g1::TRINITY_DN792_c0_g1_i1::g.29063::m.29063